MNLASALISLFLRFTTFYRSFIFPISTLSRTNLSITLFSFSYLALWYRIIKNPDVSTGPLTHLFAPSLALLTH